MQSARGAALTGDASTPPPAENAPTPHGSALLRFGAMPVLLGTASVVLLLDQLTKYIAVRELTDREPVTLIHGESLPWDLNPLLRLRLVHNPGAAFGLASEVTFLLPLLAVIVCVIILRTARRLGSLSWTLGLALLLGGALGNLVDRIVREPGGLRGQVVDFLELTRYWPVFNVADMAIVGAAVLLAVLSITGRQLDGTSVGTPHLPRTRHTSAEKN